ncbi:MAG: hypothetical protein MUD05_09560 [Candidatus Nanopelagicales bacterium]|nr:hypothetical protein [Candidatus Nanopelagicales bacterium]
MRHFASRRVLTAAITAATASVAAVPAVNAAESDTQQVAFYSPAAHVPWASNYPALRTYYSTNHPEYDLQSYVFFGGLRTPDGNVTAFNVLAQRTDGFLPAAPTLSYAVVGASLNQQASPGYVGVGQQGLPDVTLPLNQTKYPWAIRSEMPAVGSQPSFLDVRVVAGRVGQRGAVYEITGDAPAAALTGTPDATGSARIWIRAQDVLGAGKWGYGPSGFFPQWLYPAQRAVIARAYRSDVGKYLAATGDPMAGQGSYYYSAPMLKVQRFRIALAETTRDTTEILKGKAGWLWWDTVTQSFNAQADTIVNNGVTWTEFSVNLPATRTAYKIGEVSQASVGTLPYAMNLSPRSHTGANTLLTPQRSYPYNQVKIRPETAAGTWTSPRSGKTYYTQYRVALGKPGSPGRERFVLQSAWNDQEITVGNRAVYEGYFRVSTPKTGKTVGWAWGEIQPKGTL